MYRNVFRIIAALMLGSNGASAAVQPASPMPLEKRIEAAQKTIDNLITDQRDSTADAGVKVAHEWGDHWHNWNNWHDHWHDHHR